MNKLKFVIELSDIPEKAPDNIPPHASLYIDTETNKEVIIYGDDGYLHFVYDQFSEVKEIILTASREHRLEGEKIIQCHPYSSYEFIDTPREVINRLMYSAARTGEHPILIAGLGEWSGAEFKVKGYYSEKIIFADDLPIAVMYVQRGDTIYIENYSGEVLDWLQVAKGQLHPHANKDAWSNFIERIFGEGVKIPMPTDLLDEKTYEMSKMYIRMNRGKEKMTSKDVWNFIKIMAFGIGLLYGIAYIYTYLKYG